MPLPKPKSGETREAFMERCMSDDTMVEEYPTSEQRAAVCMRQWKSSQKAARRGKTWRLFADDQPAATHALVLGTYPPTRNGVQAFYYWRPVVCDGEFQHPTEKWSLVVTPERRIKWEQAFRRLLAAGVEHPIVLDHRTDAESLVGYVLNVRQEGDWYWELHQYLGEESRDVALKNYCSIAVNEHYIGSDGVDYGEVIEHTAITPVPVIPGQGEAVPLQFSEGGQRNHGDILRLATRVEAKMMIAITDEQMAELKKLLGDDTTTENLLERTLKVLAGARAQADEYTKQLSAAQQQTERLTEELALAKGKLAESESTIKQLSLHATPAPPEGEALEAFVEADEAALDALVTSGAINKVTRDALARVLLGTPEKRSLCLSKAHTGTEHRISKLVLAALKDNRPVPIGPGREEPDAKKGEDGEMTPERRRFLLSQTAAGREILAREDREKARA